jgi:hypothetical protein
LAAEINLNPLRHFNRFFANTRHILSFPQRA